MADSNESLADVLAEMREDEIETEDGVIRLDDYADRIEAAVKRAPGNAAAMRAALKRAVDELDYIQQSVNPDGITISASRALRDCRAALAAPARNCGRFATAEEARRAFEEEHSREIVHNLYTAAFDWLFAPAEGGAKCIDGLRGHPDCRGCNEHCEDVRKRNCFYWNPDIGKCALDGKPSCRIACDNFSPATEAVPAKGGAE